MPRPPSDRSRTPQTEHPAYRLAFQDMDFLLREDLRPVRFQLELLKPELLLDEAKIASTFVIYGSARIPEPAKAQALLRRSPTDDAAQKIAERLIAKSQILRRRARAGAAWSATSRATRTASAISSSARAAARRSWRRRIAARRMSAPNRSGSTSCCRTSRRPTPMSRPSLSLPVPLFRAAQDALPAPCARAGGVPGRVRHVRRDCSSC